MSVLGKITHCYENITPLQTAMIISVTFLYILYLFLREKNVPPGPTGLPLLGYWPFLKTDTCHLHFQELSQKYGDVFSVRVAGSLLINLGSIKAIREAHITKSDHFAERYTDCIVSYVFGGAVALSNGEEYKVLRKFFVSKFKEYGMNAVKENSANSVYDALKETVEELQMTEGLPTEITDTVAMKSMKIIRRVMFNDQGITVEELHKLCDLYSEIMTCMSSTNLMLIGKFARYFMFPFMPSIWRMKSHCKQLESTLFGVINRHKSERNESYVADILDSFYKERDEKLKKGDPAAQYFTDKALVNSISQFLTDGALTLGAFLGQFFTALVDHPEDQDRIYQEIMEVVGSERLPTIEDKTKLPYTNAFIYEVTRFTDFFPLFPSLQCTKETTLQGYKIPKGSITLLNFYGAHRNPKYFENPEEFNPSRYLTSPNKPRPDLPVLFGVGRRACMGEGFTMTLTFFFLTTIVQNFKLSLPDGSQGSTVMFWANDKLEICAHPRNHKS